MNSATRVLSLMTNTDGTAANAFNRLLFSAVAESMVDDDAVRPMTSTLAYLESLLPGSSAIQRLRTKYADILTAESK